MIAQVMQGVEILSFIIRTLCAKFGALWLMGQSAPVYAINDAQHLSRLDSREHISRSVPSEKFVGKVYLTETDDFAAGGFGTVRKGQMKTNRIVIAGCVLWYGMIDVAMKSPIFRMDQYTEEQIRNKVANEARIWSGLFHPNIKPFIGFSIGRASLPSLVAPYYKHRTIKSYLERVGQNKPEIFVKLIAQFTNALVYMHCRKIPVIHGDIKGDNILIDDDGNARLADFGLSSRMSTKTEREASSVGTLQWMAPELLLDDNLPDNNLPDNNLFDNNPNGIRTTATDVWAWAMTVFEVLSGRKPYGQNGRGRIVLAIRDGESPIRPKNPLITDTIWTVLNACWNSDPTSRPAIRNIGLIFDLLYVLGMITGDAQPNLPEETVTQILAMELPEPHCEASDVPAFLCKWPGCNETFDAHIACCEHEYDCCRVPFQI